MQTLRCPLCRATAASRDELRAHVDDVHHEHPGPGHLTGFRRAVGTTRGRILVPVRVDHDQRLLLDLVVELSRHGHAMLDFVSVPDDDDDRLVVSVLRALSEASCCRGAPSARWRLLDTGPPVERLLDDLDDLDGSNGSDGSDGIDGARPDLVCLPAARPGAEWEGPGDVAGALVRRAPVPVLLVGPGAVPVLSVPPVPPVVLRSVADEPFHEIGRRSDALVRRLGLSVYRRPRSVDPDHELVLHVPPADRARA